jgi:gamma-glutamylcyclotransferase (GGCT)/AIG2-like uncharacterized protein YtfP
MEVTSPPLFVYGTLQYKPILDFLLRRVPTCKPAVIRGYTRCKIIGLPYPAVIGDPAGSVEGMLLFGLQEDEMEVLHDYEGEEYVLKEGVEAVSAGGDTATCSLYLWRHEYMDMLVQPLEPWDQLAFEKNDMDAFVASLRSGVSAMESWDYTS